MRMRVREGIDHSRSWTKGFYESLVQFILKPSNMHCIDTGMIATGIPPLYVFMHNQIELHHNVIKALEKSETQVPVPAKI